MKSTVLPLLLNSGIAGSQFHILVWCNLSKTYLHFCKYLNREYYNSKIQLQVRSSFLTLVIPWKPSYITGTLHYKNRYNVHKYKGKLYPGLQLWISNIRMCFWNWEKSYYLLIVFGSGVLFLFIQCSQPCLPACVWAGAAQWLVCSTLSNGIKSRGNTALSQSARQLYLQCFFPLTCYSSVIQNKKAQILPWHSVMLKNKE